MADGYAERKRHIVTRALGELIPCPTETCRLTLSCALSWSYDHVEHVSHSSTVHKTETV